MDSIISALHVVYVILFIVMLVACVYARATMDKQKNMFDVAFGNKWFADLPLFVGIFFISIFGIYVNGYHIY